LSNYYHKQDFDGAVQYLKSFAASNEGLFDYNRDLGYALYMGEAFNEAKFYLKNASRLQPGDITPIFASPAILLPGKPGFIPLFL